METVLGVKNHSNVVTTDFMAQLGVLVSGTGVLNIYRKSRCSNPQCHADWTLKSLSLSALPYDI